MTTRHLLDSVGELQVFYTPSLFSEFVSISLKLIQRQICLGPIF